MYIAIIAVIVLLLFSIWLVSSFFVNILELIINLVILWAVCVRGYVELEKEKKHNYYFVGLLAAMVVFLAARVNIFSEIRHIWAPVLFLVMVFLVAQLVFAFHRIYIEKYKK